MWMDVTLQLGRNLLWSDILKFILISRSNQSQKREVDLICLVPYLKCNLKKAKEVWEDYIKSKYVLVRKKSQDRSNFKMCSLCMFKPCRCDWEKPTQDAQSIFVVIHNKNYLKSWDSPRLAETRRVSLSEQWKQKETHLALTDNFPVLFFTIFSLETPLHISHSLLKIIREWRNSYSVLFRR